MTQSQLPDPTEPLIAFLRTKLNSPDLAYQEPPVQLLGGNETTIYAFRLANAPEDAWRKALILRVLNLRDTPVQQCAFESAVQNALADAGLPVPRSLTHAESSEVLGGPFFIMERAPGDVMLPDLGPLSILFGLRDFLSVFPERLADIHAQLLSTPVSALDHSLQDNPTFASELSYGAWFTACRRSIENWNLDGLREGLLWVEAHAAQPGTWTALCHGDFHPLNILEQDGEVTAIIDWSKPCIAEPEFDVGNTCVVLDLVTVSLPRPLLPLGRYLQHSFMRTYLRRMQELIPLNPERIRYAEAMRCLRELSALEALAARRRQGETVLDGTAPASWDVPRLVAHFRAITGVELHLAA